MPEKFKKQRKIQQGSGGFLKFLGTAGARFVMLKQLRASGGIWINYEGVNVLLDPGPGSLLRCLSSRPKLDPEQLDSVIITHRHLDHSNDVNVMLEAMTEGGFRKRGSLFLPADAIDSEPIISSHIRGAIERVEILKENAAYTVGKLKFFTAMRHIHSVETYGLKFELGARTVGLISDTRYFDELSHAYGSDILIINVVFHQPHPGVDHLSLADAENIIKISKPKEAIITHFGMSMLKAKPHILEDELRNKLGVNVICAYDGMTIPIV